MPVIKFLRNYSIFSPSLRNSGTVKLDLKSRGIEPDYISVQRLRKYSPEQYLGVMSVIDRLKGMGHDFNQVAVDKRANLPTVRLKDLPNEILANCLHGKTLDLRDMRQRLQDSAALKINMPVESPLLAVGTHMLPPGLVDFLSIEDAYLRRIASQPGVTLAKLFRSLDYAAGRLRRLGFENVAIYKPREDGSGKWELTYATRKFGESSFDPGKGGSIPDPNFSTIGWIICHGESGYIYDLNIYDESTFKAGGIPYFRDKAEQDRRCTIGSGRTLFIKIASRYGTEAVVQIHNRVENMPGMAEPRPLLPEKPEEANRVLTLLRLYFNVEVVSVIERIREIMPAAPIVFSVPAEPKDLAPVLLGLVRRKSQTERFGGFEVGRIATPAANLAEDEKIMLADALNWQRRDRNDMRAHLENANEVIVVFWKGQPVSFYSGQEIDFNNKGRQEKLIVIAGVMNNRDFRGFRMQAFVTGLSMLKTWWKHKLLGGLSGLFSAPYVIMRTRTEWTAADFMEHFSGVVHENLSERDLNRAREFSRCMDMKKNCDENGVVRGAYSQPLRDREKDLKIVEKLKTTKPKLYDKIKSAFNGLSELDARVFQGRLTLWFALKFWLYVHIVFPWRNQQLKNRVADS